MNIVTSKANADYDWATQLNRYFMKPIGLWPANDRGNKRNRIVTVLVLMFLTLCLFACTIPLICSLIVSRDDLMLFIDNLAYFAPVMMAHLKYYVIYNKKKVLLTVLNMIAEDWTKVKTDAEETVMIRQARICRIISIFCFMICVLLMILLCILPRFGISIRYVTNETDVRKTFPLPAYYMFDVYRSPYFEIMQIVHYMYMWPLVTAYAGVDNFLGMLIFHVCGRLKNLRVRLASMRESKSFQRALSTSVENHVQIVRTVDTIENTFSFLLLTELLYYILFLCIYGLLLFSIFDEKYHVSTMRMVFLISVFMCTFLQTLFYCIAGQLLVTQSEGLFYGAYQCDWINLKPNEARSLIMIMARTRTPLNITAGKLFPMTMVTFCNTLKVSLSYISFLVTKI